MEPFFFYNVSFRERKCTWTLEVPPIGMKCHPIGHTCCKVLLVLQFYFSTTFFWVVPYKFIQFLWIHLQGPELLTADSMLPVMAADDAWHHGTCVACSAKTDLWQGEWRCIRRWIKDDQGIWRLQRHHCELILKDLLNARHLEFEYPQSVHVG